MRLKVGRNPGLLGMGHVGYAFGALVVTGCCGTEVFKFVEEPFDQFAGGVAEIAEGGQVDALGIGLTLAQAPRTATR